MSEGRGMSMQTRVKRSCLRPLLVGVLSGCVAWTSLSSFGAVAGPLGRGPSPYGRPPSLPAAGRGAGEEFAVLIVLHLTAAEMNCPFRIEEGRLKRLLNHHGFSLGDVYALSRSDTLSAE